MICNRQQGERIRALQLVEGVEAVIRAKSQRKLHMAWIGRIEFESNGVSIAQGVW